MRTISTAETNLLSAGAYSIHLRFDIRDGGGNWVDYSDWVEECSWDEDIDNPVMGMSATLAFRDGSTNLSPLVGATLPIDIGREVRVRVGYAAPSGTPSVFHNVFQGYLDLVDASGYNEMRLEARDLGGALMDAYVEEERTYGSAAPGSPMVTVMQAILNDWAPGVTLYAPVDPGANLSTFRAEKGPVLEVLRNLALLIGWDVGYRWDSSAASWRLTLINPNRAVSTPDYTLSSDLYLKLSKTALDRSSVRNVVRVVYGPNPGRAVVTRSDSTSISRYGRRFMELAEAEDSAIDTQAEAERFADAALADLKDPKVELEAELHLFPWVQLGDFYAFSPNGIHFDAEQRAAVVGVRHRYALGERRTTLSLRGQPAGAYSRWFWREGGRGTNPPPETDAPTAPTGMSSSFTGLDALFAWAAVDGAEYYEVEVWTQGIRRRTENTPHPAYVYPFDANRSDSGGTPRSAVQLIVRAVRAGGLKSAPTSHTASNPAPGAPSGFTIDPTKLGFLVSVGNPTEGDIDYLEIQADDNNSFASPRSYTSYAWSAVEIPADPAGLTYLRARWVDRFGQPSGWTATIGNTPLPIDALVDIGDASLSIRKLFDGNTDNLAEDGGFEADSTTWTAWQTPFSVITDAAQAFSGKRFARMTPSGAAYPNLQNANRRIWAQAGDLFYLEARVRRVSGTVASGSVGLAFLMANGSHQYGSVQVALTTAGQWYRASGFVTVPAGATLIDAIYVQVEAGSVTGVYDVDAVYVRRALTADEIRDGAIYARHVVAGQITTQALASHAVIAEKIAIGDSSNMVTNSSWQFGSTDAERLSGWTHLELLNTPGAGAGINALQRDRDVYYRIGYADAMPCERGRKYWVSCYAVNYGGSLHDFAVGAGFYDVNGNIILFAAAAVLPPSTNVYTLVQGMVTAPANAVRMFFWTQIYKGYGVDLDKPWAFHSPVMRRAVAGELIVDGAVQAYHLAVVTATAGKIYLGSNNPNASRMELEYRGGRVYEGANLGLAFGDIGGLQRGSGTLANGTWGLWGRLGAGVYIEGAPRVLRTSLGTSITFSTVNLYSGGSTTREAYSAEVTLPAPWVKIAGLTLAAAVSIKALEENSIGGNAYIYRFGASIQFWNATVGAWQETETLKSAAAGNQITKYRIYAWMGIRNNTNSSLDFTPGVAVDAIVMELPN